MEMTFQKIEQPAEPKPEHPAYRAARMIRELHAENIAKIDGGFVFLKDGVDVSAEMRKSCEEQIAMCDIIMARANKLDPKLWEPSAVLLGEIEVRVAEANASGDTLASILPEVGNYDHEKT
jgi:hypothetical protein